MAREVPLTNGGTFLVDDQDYPWVSRSTWSRHKQGYIMPNSKIGPHRTQPGIHRLILGDVPGMDIDHVNGQKWDNRRCNLRHCTRSQNCANRRGWQKSGYKGVARVAGYTNKWYASIQGDKQPKYLGCFDTPDAAARAYDAAARHHFGQCAYTNFPQEEPMPDYDFIAVPYDLSAQLQRHAIYEAVDVGTIAARAICAWLSVHPAPSAAALQPILDAADAVPEE